MLRLSLVAIAAAACVPLVPPTPPRAVNLGLEITSSKLANGLRVVVVNDANAVDVQVTMRFAVGAIDDGADPGIAHLVEHLMFQQEIDGQPLFAHLEDTATFFNALTSYDSTSYIARAPKAALGRLLALEATRLDLRCATITDDAFANERAVVANEIAQRDRSSTILTAIHRALYPADHPYQASIGGSSETLAEITREEACAFIDAHYAPGNAALVVAGNVDAAAVRAALAPLERVAARATVPQRVVPPIAPSPRHQELALPVDEDIFVVAWPLPTTGEARVRAVVAALVRKIDSEIKGTVASLDLGDLRAPMIGIAVVPGDGETFQQAIDGTRRAIDSFPTLFNDHAAPADAIAFDRMKQSAIHDRYAALEDGSGRDLRLATLALSGVDPAAAIREELDELGGLTRPEARRIATTYLSSATPTGLTVRATEKRSGPRVALQAPQHDMGPRRSPVDATRAAREIAPSAVAGARTRVLPNGLRVILLPLPSVPTFDARLIFASGTADEPAKQRGVALLAAHSLTWDLHYFDDLVAFAKTGGIRDTDVGTDRTTFAVQGLDPDLHTVLAGLRRWVRDGTYDDSAADVLRALQRATKTVDDQGVATDAWRAALFGANHPYVHAGLGRHASTSLSLENAATFRSAHYTPDNATLVLAGHFDAALADRWIDYLFADWRGTHVTQAQTPVAQLPLSLARIDDSALVQMRMAMPAAAATRAHRLVGAEMLAIVARDVRYRLGASYTVDAQLAEMRNGSFYVIDGYLETARATPAMEIIRDRIAALRTDGASTFILARDRVLARLQSQVGSATSLAAGVDGDIGAGRDPLSDVATARDVRALSLAAMAPVLAELDLAHATVLLSGPDAELRSAFAAIGRTPTYLAAVAPAPATAAPSTTTPSLGAYEQHVPINDLEPALTVQRPPYWLASFSASRSWRAFDDVPTSGYMFGAGIGLRLGHSSYGMHVFAGSLSNAAGSIIPVEIALHAHFQGSGPLYADGMLGVRYVRDSTSTWEHSTAFTFRIGLDIIPIGNGRLGFVLGYGSSVLSLGLAYRP